MKVLFVRSFLREHTDIVEFEVFDDNYFVEQFEGFDNSKLIEKMVDFLNRFSDDDNVTLRMDDDGYRNGLDKFTGRVTAANKSGHCCFTVREYRFDADFYDYAHFHQCNTRNNLDTVSEMKDKVFHPNW